MNMHENVGATPKYFGACVHARANTHILYSIQKQAGKRHKQTDLEIVCEGVHPQHHLQLLALLVFTVLNHAPNERCSIIQHPQETEQHIPQATAPNALPFRLHLP
jgi:hypothetical protein